MTPVIEETPASLARKRTRCAASSTVAHLRMGMSLRARPRAPVFE
jgi:hypothetical protein